MKQTKLNPPIHIIDIKEKYLDGIRNGIKWFEVRHKPFQEGTELWIRQVNDCNKYVRVKVLHCGQLSRVVGKHTEYNPVWLDAVRLNPTWDQWCERYIAQKDSWLLIIKRVSYGKA